MQYVKCVSPTSILDGLTSAFIISITMLLLIQIIANNEIPTWQATSSKLLGDIVIRPDAGVREHKIAEYKRESANA